jgi:hypothetical protein
LNCGAGSPLQLVGAVELLFSETAVILPSKLTMDWRHSPRGIKTRRIAAVVFAKWGGERSSTALISAISAHVFKLGASPPHQLLD